MAKASLRLVTPSTLKRTVTPTRQKNAALRTREYLTDSEIEKLTKAAGRNRYGHRDATMILVAYRHGLRASELCGLEWSQVDFATGTMHVRRVKQGSPSVHPIRGDELRALRKLQRNNSASPYVFLSERGAPFTTAGFARIVERAGVAAKLSAVNLIRTCCAMPAGMPWRTLVTIRALYRHISAIGTSSTPFVTLSLLRIGSRASGGSDTSYLT